MKISGCLMVKNEEKNIEKCIDSFKNVVNEIIVVDTGSTDNTVKIAKQCGAKVYHYDWNSDFASARNVAIEKAVGDWIIFLDADEFFYANTGSNIPNLLSQAAPNVNSLLCKIVNIDNSDMKEKSTAHVIRVFRNNKKIRYNHKIHEIVLDKGKPMTSAIVAPEALLIYHTGYSSEMVVSKFERNLKLLLDEEKKDKFREITYFYIGDCYFGLKKYELAIEYMRKYITTGHKNTGSNMKPYSIIIEAMFGLGYKYNEILEEISLAIEKFPNHPLLYRHRATLESINNNFQVALEFFHKTLELQEVYNDVETNFVEGSIYNIYYNIASLYEYKNDFSNAVEYYVKSLKEKYDYTLSFDKLIRIIRHEDPTEVVILLKSIFDESNELHVKFLVNELSKLKLGKVLLYYTNIWHKSFNKEDNNLIFTFLANGNYEEAYKYFHNCYFEDWGYSWGMFSLISALLSENKENINEIKDYVKPSFRRFILAYEGDENILFIADDQNDYLSILREFTLLGLEKQILKILDMKVKFDCHLLDPIGNVLMDLAYYELAIKNYTECLMHENVYNKGYIYNKIGIAYYRICDYENALEFIEKSLESGNKDNALFNYLQWTSVQCKDDLIKLKAEDITKRYMCQY